MNAENFNESDEYEEGLTEYHSYTAVKVMPVVFKNEDTVCLEGGYIER